MRTGHGCPPKEEENNYADAYYAKLSILSKKEQATDLNALENKSEYYSQFSLLLSLLIGISIGYILVSFFMKRQVRNLKDNTESTMERRGLIEMNR